ncbi:MAG: hypothetical protein WBV23_16170, partial [Desulfobaccales bacterium]
WIDDYFFEFGLIGFTGHGFSPAICNRKLLYAAKIGTFNLPNPAIIPKPGKVEDMIRIVKEVCLITF